MIGLIGFLIVGLIAGWIAEKIMKRDHGLITNLIVGVVGAYIGGWLLRLVGLSPGDSWIPAIITAVIGAVVLLAILGFVTGRNRA